MSTNTQKIYSQHIIQTLIDMDKSDCEDQFIGNESVFQRLCSIYVKQEGNDDELRELFPHYV